jgi:hypothetical protein
MIFEFGTPIKLSDVDSKNISVPGNPAYSFIRILYPEFDSLRNCDRQNAIVDFDKVIRNAVEFSYFGATASRFELEFVGYRLNLASEINEKMKQGVSISMGYPGKSHL